MIDAMLLRTSVGQQYFGHKEVQYCTVPLSQHSSDAVGAVGVVGAVCRALNVHYTIPCFSD